MARTAKPVPCPWCKAKTLVMPEMGGVGWRVVCNSPMFGPAPCRVAGPIRLDPLTAVDAWNEVLTVLPQAVPV
jgi:hypothetical protein